jgi:hypothetical protein
MELQKDRRTSANSPTIRRKATSLPTRIITAATSPTRIRKATSLPTRIRKATSLPTRIITAATSPTRIRKATSLPSRMPASSFPSSRKSQLPSYNSGSRVFSNDIYKVLHENLNARKIQQFMKDKIIINKNTLKNRINRYNILMKKLSLVKDDDCLEEKTFNGENGYTIRNIINLEKKIGRESKHGTIYLTHIPNLIGVYPIATKIMKFNSENIKEVGIMKGITNNIILKKLSRHFLMIYSSSLCEQEIPEIPEKLKFTMVNELTDEDLKMLCERRNIPRIPENRRLISVNELADGDLQTLMTNRNILEDNDLILNLLFQTYISIATFQNNMGYVHKDTHDGNFLFHYNNENIKGYYHYVFNEKDYYLKCCKYNIIIFDFGKARDIFYESDILNIHRDYENILFTFMKKKGSIYDDLPKDETNNITKQILNEMNKLYYKKSYKRPLEKHLFSDIIENIFLKYTPKDMFITERPSIILNSVPFKID